MSLRRLIKRIPGARQAGRWLRARTFKYFCPVCGERVEQFNALDRVFADNRKKHGWPFRSEDSETINPAQYSCPHCDASDRYRLYALYLNERLAQSAPCELLEFAPLAPMRTFLGKFPGVRYRTADLFATGVDDRVDIMDMATYQDGRFGVFICSHVLEHVPDDRKALAELYRILKPSGWGILMVPINLASTEIDEDPGVTDVIERWRRFGQNDHVRLYTKPEFLKRVAAAGFVIRQFGVDHFGRTTFERCGLTLQSVLYVVEKPAVK